jgi:hypothetical protein
MDVADPPDGHPPTTEETMMKSRTAKVFGTIVAAVTLTMVTSVAPASAAKSDGKGGGGATVMKRDTGWDIP